MIWDSSLRFDMMNIFFDSVQFHEHRLHLEVIVLTHAHHLSLELINLSVLFLLSLNENDGMIKRFLHQMIQIVFSQYLDLASEIKVGAFH